MPHCLHGKYRFLLMASPRISEGVAVFHAITLDFRDQPRFSEGVFLCQVVYILSFTYFGDLSGVLCSHKFSSTATATSALLGQLFNQPITLLLLEYPFNFNQLCFTKPPSFKVLNLSRFSKILPTFLLISVVYHVPPSQTNSSCHFGTTKVRFA